MKKDLTIALKRHKRLIVLFLLTIFLPSVLLSVLGIKAIRNEKFRLVKQFEEEQIRMIDLFRAQILSRVNEVENDLQYLVQTPSFLNQDVEAIKILLDSRLVENHLIDHFFVVYRNADPWFPPLQPVLNPPVSISTFDQDEAWQEKLKKAEEYEFVQKNYKSAVSVYNDLLAIAKDKNHQAQLLNHLARNLTKLEDYKQAISIYLRIANNYPESKTSAGVPLVIIARLQLTDSYEKSGEFDNALNEAFKLYEKLLLNSWSLNESQFKIYASMVKESITEILEKSPTELADKEEYIKQFEQLTKIHQGRIEQWQIINDLKREIIPEFRQKITQPGTYTPFPFRYSKTINNQDFLTITLMIPDENNKDSQGILGAKINNGLLENDILNDIIKVIHSGDSANFTISNLTGHIIYGKKSLSEEIPKITAFFENNFPPWKIEAYGEETNIAGLIGLHKSFYFWTILTLILILSFGVALMVRTIAHEMEVLKIKSDFVSSVSHEFKTPLTSISALIERLSEGKVKDQDKIKQYYSVITQDTEKLSRLVGNILDFAKMEEGKMEYDFEETDIEAWLDQTIENFRKENLQREIKLHTRIQADIPYLKIDKNALAQAVNNLLDNAIKSSTKKNEIEVIIRRDENHLKMEVKDYGIGIPRDELDRIFEKFYQGSNAIRLSTKGTGLGLTLVRHTVEAHGGEVYVESKLGVGSTFTISLPIKRKSEGG